MTMQASPARRPWLFTVLVFVLSAPLYLAGNLSLLPASAPIHAPVFVLACVIPVSVAHVLLYRERGQQGIQALWRSMIDARRIRPLAWFAPILLLMPAVMAVTYLLETWAGVALPDPQFRPLEAVGLLLVFLVLAAGEEAGWSGYMTGALQARWSALTSGLALGAIWAAWHVIPYAQAHPSAPAWVLWQCAGTVALRVLMVWIFNNTSGSLLAGVLFHAMINQSEFMYPNLGSHYEPFVPFLILAGIAAVVTWAWGPETLARPPFKAP